MEDERIFLHQSMKYPRFSTFLKTTYFRCCIMAQLWCIGTARAVPQGRRWYSRASIAPAAPSYGKSHLGVP